MEQRKHFPTRYYIGAVLIVLSFLSLLIDSGNGDLYMLPLWLFFVTIAWIFSLLRKKKEDENA